MPGETRPRVPMSNLRDQNAIRSSLIGSENFILPKTAPIGENGKERDGFASHGSDTWAGVPNDVKMVPGRGTSRIDAGEITRQDAVRADEERRAAKTIQRTAEIRAKIASMKTGESSQLYTEDEKVALKRDINMIHLRSKVNMAYERDLAAEAAKKPKGFLSRIKSLFNRG